MFGYQVILEVGGKKYDLEQTDFSFSQATDETGKPQGEVYSGMITMTYPSLPTNELINWMMNARKYEDGVITTYGEDGTPMQKLEFKQATCVSMKIDYQETGSSYCNCEFMIVANKINVGDAAVDNDWERFKN
ncbi:MAG: type VI secretion system needle protein Hcp [Paludibacteraceae bacterium]|nr:type VI secretion system needle protein Hcp [Paludibacteraceae bacterium]